MCWAVQKQSCLLNFLKLPEKCMCPERCVLSGEAPAAQHFGSELCSKVVWFSSNLTRGVLPAGLRSLLTSPAAALWFFSAVLWGSRGKQGVAGAGKEAEEGDRCVCKCLAPSAKLRYRELPCRLWNSFLGDSSQGVPSTPAPGVLVEQERTPGCFISFIKDGC